MGSGDFRPTAPAQRSTLGFAQPHSASFMAKVRTRSCEAVRILASLLGFGCRRDSLAESFGMQRNLSKVPKAGYGDCPQRCCRPA